MILWEIILPLWGANVAVNVWWILRMKKKWPDPPLDGGMNFCDGKRIFGNARTIAGIPITVFFGWLTGLCFHINHGVQLGICMYVGAIVTSFLKRRLGISTHGSFPIIDQSDYFIVAIIYLSIIGHRYSWESIFLTFIFTIIVHVVTNKIAFALKLRSTPW